jgi:pyruvate/2-oxoglutarate dehydrogenase complex dihydrolipoamide dehydrogenase (E3) component
MNREGLKVAIVERHKIGDTCVNVGCIPTKTLVGSARVAALARRAVEFGIVNVTKPDCIFTRAFPILYPARAYGNRRLDQPGECRE